jgi:anti-sigma factor RsiW
MNCTIVETLLPLYVEGDASEREAEAVRSHLSGCQDCRAVAEEFRASQSRLHNFAAPEFGAAFYEQIRGAVLREINSGNANDARRPSLFEALRASFQWRPAVAFSLALLMLAGALSLTALYRSRLETGAALSALDKSMGDFSLSPQIEAERIDRDSNGGSVRVSNTGFTARNTARQRSARGARATVQPESAMPQSTNTAATASAEVKQKTAPVNQNAAAPVQAVARMEIQTSDPNIRIIWLAPKISE